MVAAKCLNPSFISLDFWRRIPSKFQGIRLYEDKKTKIKEVILYTIFSLKKNIYIYLSFSYVQLAEIRSASCQKKQQQQLQQQLRSDLGSPNQQNQQETPNHSTETGRKRKPKTKKKNECQEIPTKKKKDEGETIEEQIDEFDPLLSNLGESIYKDFDDPKY